MKRVLSVLIVLGLFVALASVHSCKPAAPKADTTKVAAVVVPVMNTLTDKEKAEGWVLLFDGKTTTGWRGYNKPAFPDSGWVVENNTLHCVGSGNGEAGGKGGDHIFDKKFKDFDLSLEWKISPGGNSGILYMAIEI